jgi:TPR repeat protein
MAKAYLMGLGTERDIGKASELMNAIRAEGEYRNARSTLLAADWLAFSTSERNPQISVSLLKGQAGRGSVSAEGALGKTYLSGFGPTLEPDSAASHLFRAANAGDKDAMASLGQLLLNGYGVSRSRDAGLAWLRRSAEAGNTAAMYDLSRIFALDAARVPANESAKDEAAYWLTRAGERNHANASYQLGVAQLNGGDRPADVGKAAVWLERSARAGNLLAARKLEAVRRQMTEAGEFDPTTVSNE